MLVLDTETTGLVYNHLTPDQRDELDTMASERQERRAERRAQRPGQS